MKQIQFGYIMPVDHMDNVRTGDLCRRPGSGVDADQRPL